MRIGRGHLDDATAVWYWEARGSGLHINLGRTVIVDPLIERMETFRQVELLVASGSYDTAQFPLSAYFLPRAMTNNRFEIVDLRHRGAELSTKRAFTCVGSHRAGWNATEGCNCIERPDVAALNCDGRMPPFSFSASGLVN
jgi:hypothetical protein